MGDVEYGKIYDFYLPPAFLRLYDGPSVNVEDMWRILGRGTTNGGLVVGTIIKPKLGLQPKPFGEACYSFWQGGDFIKNDEPQGNQVFCQMNECIPEVVKAMRACVKETGSSKLFSANITADDPEEMIARGKYIMSQFGPLSENCAFLVDGYVAGGTAVTCCRRNFPKQFLHYHRAGHGSVTSPQTQRGYTAFVHTKISRVIGASGIHVGTMSFGKMEGDASDKNIAYMLQDDEADGPYYRQEWQGMKETTPIISGGMNALRLPAFFENLGHSNVILTAGGGSFGHKDGPKIGAISCRQGEEAWKQWKAGQFGNISLSDGVIEYAKTHEEIKGAFLTFQKDADQIYPGWKEKLGYTGESSVQAASFDWAKRASAAAFVGASVAPAKKENVVARQALDQSSRYADLSLDEDTLIRTEASDLWFRWVNQESTKLYIKLQLFDLSLIYVEVVESHDTWKSFSTDLHGLTTFPPFIDDRVALQERQARAGCLHHEAQGGLWLLGHRCPLCRGVLHWYQRERVHHWWLHQVCGCPGVLHRPWQWGDEDRLPNPAVRPQHHRWPRNDVLFLDLGHWKQSGQPGSTYWFSD